MTPAPLPANRPLIAWYGDDFTGAAAVMETLAFAGLPAVLFLDIPTPEQIRAFADCRAFGIAGIARAKSPAWMEHALPPIFHALARFDAAIAQYKVCSTFDSSPAIGSIGRAATLAAPILGGAWTPLLVASPAVGRYQAFGNLFARAGDSIHRLDRHPTMRRHPVTPMTESDVRLHLAQQTSAPISLVDLVAMKAGRGDAALAAALAAGAAIIALDVIDTETLREAGRLIWSHRGQRLFAIGSQGLEEALIAHWR
ncbi:MAG TPA: four-carbon acid sugar kinase family protein, partial [Acetobacteraceae bacterium]|nr:four-carbon acid sugar kinase family protein [Acetobacteraceae bacterium]